MSLTTNLDDRQSPVYRFFRECFPQTSSMVRQCNAELAMCTTLRSATSVHFGTIGMAFDYRVRYYFAVTPHEQLLAYRGAALVSDKPFTLAFDLRSNVSGETEVGGKGKIPAKLIQSFFSSLDEALQRIRPVGRQLSNEEERELARYCLVLALFEEFVRVQIRAAVIVDSPLLRTKLRTVSDVLAVVAEPWIEDVCSLSWLFCNHYKERFSQPAMLNPTFDGGADVGGADADLILGKCLLELKTTVTGKVQALWFYQMLGYLLLDYGDKYQIGEVGLYMARQGLEFRWPVQKFLDQLSEKHPVALPTQRRAFRQLTHLRR